MRRAGAEIVVLTWAQTFGRDARAPKADAGHVDPAPGDGERGDGDLGLSDDGAGRVVVLGKGKPGS